MIQSQARRNLIARQSGEHCHDFAQLLFGWRGGMACEFHSGSDLLKQGNVAVVPEESVHFFDGLTDESELLVVDIAANDPCIQALEQACGLSLQQTLFSNPEFVELAPASQPLLEFAGQQLVNGAAANQLINYQLVTLLLTQLCQQFSPDSIRPLVNQRINPQQLNRYIDQHIAEPLSNARLASAMHLSESYFYAIFQQQFATTPQRYILNRRMQAACYQLQHSRKSLAVLADELGFADAASLSRAFKRHFQQTPGSLRKQFQR